VHILHVSGWTDAQLEHGSQDICGTMSRRKTCTVLYSPASRVETATV
jgi:hypothetical protein